MDITLNISSYFDLRTSASPFSASEISPTESPTSTSDAQPRTANPFHDDSFCGSVEQPLDKESHTLVKDINSCLVPNNGGLGAWYANVYFQALKHRVNSPLNVIHDGSTKGGHLQPSRSLCLALFLHFDHSPVL